MQLVVPVVQINGHLVNSGYSGPEKYFIATPLLLQLDLSRPCWAQNLLESKFACAGIFPVRQLNAIATPFINAMVTLLSLSRRPVWGSMLVCWRVQMLCRTSEVLDCAQLCRKISYASLKSKSHPIHLDPKSKPYDFPEH